MGGRPSRMEQRKVGVGEHNELGDPALQEWETRGVVPVLQEQAEELVCLQGADVGVDGRFRAMFYQNGLGKGIHMRVQR